MSEYQYHELKYFDACFYLANWGSLRPPIRPALTSRWRKKGWL
jgi:hypothetical protein